MKPRLVAISGPLKDSVFSLAESELSIGRGTSNHVPINDSLLSRRHCRVTQQGGRFQILDLSSLNGTRVNGVPVKERWLEHGDQVAVGESRFLFLLTDEPLPPREANPVQLSEQSLRANTTLSLKVDDSLYLQPDWPVLPPASRMARDLTALVRFSTTVNSVRETEELQRELLKLVFEVVPAEHGAILLTGTEREITSVFGWDREGHAEAPVLVSRAMVRQVLEEGVAVLDHDVVAENESSSTESAETAQNASILCVPLMLFGKALGVIYLDTSESASRFREEHLHFLTIVSLIAAVAIENVRHMERLEGENRMLRAEQVIEHNMVGEGRAMRKVYQFISRVAQSDATVLIRGESGTGKELAAHAIHRNSTRSEGPFVAINCAALTESLLESELFGHERGAFTGAVAQKKGRFELADSGTLFLDEVGELAPVLQAKLLRVLQEREFERVGGARTLRVDVRVVAATNRALETAVKDGTFRQDLFYRLNVVSFEMPPLRERKEDLLLLAENFASKHAAKFKRKIEGLSEEAIACLTAYDWPGNVRELENAIERAVVLGSTARILPEDLPETVLESEPSGAAQTSSTKYHESMRQAKKQLILKTLETAGGNYTEAAKLLDVHPNYLHRLVTKLNLRAALKGK
jgi:Nif-specific regulatory protein